MLVLACVPPFAFGAGQISDQVDPPPTPSQEEIKVVVLKFAYLLRNYFQMPF